MSKAFQVFRGTSRGTNWRDVGVQIGDRRRLLAGTDFRPGARLAVAGQLFAGSLDLFAFVQPDSFLAAADHPAAPGYDYAVRARSL